MPRALKGNEKKDAAESVGLLNHNLVNTLRRTCLEQRAVRKASASADALFAMMPLCKTRRDYSAQLRQAPSPPTQIDLATGLGMRYTGHGLEVPSIQRSVGRDFR